MKKNVQLKRIREYQIIMIILLMLIAVLLMVPRVDAQTIQMANPDGTGQRDVNVYQINGTFYGAYNTTSLITIDNTSDYLFVLKPQGNSIIDDPGDWLTNYAFPYVQTHITALLLMAILMGFIFAGTRRL